MLIKVLPIIFGLLIMTGVINPNASFAAQDSTIEAADTEIESKEDAPDNEQESQATGAQQASEQEEEKQEKEEKQEQQAQEKQNRRFDSFVPSEQISADNAVPFPVDI